MFTIKSVLNLVWCNAEKTSFDCLVQYEEFDSPHPTTVIASDSAQHIRELWENGNNGVYGAIDEYSPPVAVATMPQATVAGAQTL